MIANKHITKIVAVIMAATIIFTLGLIANSDKLKANAADTGIGMEYESVLFDTSLPITVNIVMDNSDWEDMLAGAVTKEYYQCDVEINGDRFYRVGIRTKGNTSLRNIASDPDQDKYSFKLEFDQFVDDQTCYGLDKLVLNNNYADATNMKEALIYDMFQYLGADASLYNYASVSVNGEYWGLYLALEAVEDSFMLRNFGVENGELYKPDNLDFDNVQEDLQYSGTIDLNNLQPPEMNGQIPDGLDIGNLQPPGMGGQNSMEIPQFENEQTNPQDGGGMPFSPPGMGGQPSNGFGQIPDELQMPPSRGENSGSPQDFFGMPDEGGNLPTSPNMFGMGRNSGGSNLNYIDDELDSYYNIWNNEVTKTNKNDHKKVVTALKNISQGTDLEKYMDIDNLLRYAAVHIFSVNSDSLSENMSHNYYLYEANGQLNLLPWDYNLALGGMGGAGGRGSSGATGTVNSAIDDAFSGTKFFDHLLADEEYHAQYYAYLRDLVDEYLLGDGFESFYDRTRSQIDDLVKNDPNAFYSYEEYQVAAETLYEVVHLRAQSINGQLNGTIPSTKQEQQGSDALIDASHIDLSLMGTMDMGGGNQAMGGGVRPNGENFPDGENFNFLNNLFSKGGQANDGQETLPDENAVRVPGSTTERNINNSFKNYAIYGVSFLTLVIGFLVVIFYIRPKR